RAGAAFEPAPTPLPRIDARPQRPGRHLRMNEHFQSVSEMSRHGPRMAQEMLRHRNGNGASGRYRDTESVPECSKTQAQALASRDGGSYPDGRKLPRERSKALGKPSAIANSFGE